MPAHQDYHRSDRVADQMQRELAELIRLEVKDPRVGMVTLSGVEVSRDLAHAKVFFTQLEGEEKGQEAQTGLNHAAGYLRRALGHRLRLRSVPSLRFIYDDTPERGARISALIDSAIAEDAARHPEALPENPDPAAGEDEPPAGSGSESGR
jgi:ribosome-binding factor A